MADGITKTLAVIEKGAAALLGAQDAFFLERCDGGADRVPVDAEAGRQFRLGRKPLIGRQPGEDRLADLVGDLPPQRDPGASLHSFQNGFPFVVS